MLTTNWRFEITFQLLKYMYERDEIMGIRNVHNVLTPIKPLAGFGIFLSLSHTFPRNTHYRFSNTQAFFKISG